MQELSTPDFSDPHSVLYAFMEAMYRWETEAWARLGRDDRPDDHEQARAIEREVAAQLDAIFALYCTPRERKQGRQNCLAMGSPPDYDPTAETILEVVPRTSRRTEIFTKDTRPLGCAMCYVFLKRGGEWRIDSKKIKYTDGWENCYL